MTNNSKARKFGVVLIEAERRRTVLFHERTTATTVEKEMSVSYSDCGDKKCGNTTKTRCINIDATKPNFHGYKLILCTVFDGIR